MINLLYNIIIIIFGICLLTIAKDILALNKIRLISKGLIFGLCFFYVLWLFCGDRQGFLFWFNNIVLIVLFISIFLFFVFSLRYYSLSYLLSRIAKIRWDLKTLVYNKGIIKKGYPSKIILFLYDIKTELKHLSNPPSSLKSINFLGQQFSIVTYREYVNLIWEIFINNTYYLPLDYEPKFIIDGGSNIGMSILFFKTVYPNAKILGFEPNSENFSVLSKNISSGNWSNVSVENKAIFNVDGICKFDSPSSTSGQISTIEDSNIKDIVELPCVRLSSYIDQSVDILKLDIEGVETMVIEELSQAGKLKFVKNMLIEFHYGENKEKNSLALLLKILEQNNFEYQISGRRIGLLDNKCDHYDTFIYAFKK